MLEDANIAIRQPRLSSRGSGLRSFASSDGTRTGKAPILILLSWPSDCGSMGMKDETFSGWRKVSAKSGGIRYVKSAGSRLMRSDPRCRLIKRSTSPDWELRLELPYRPQSIRHPPVS
jgi:hypothetical protein